MLAVLLEEAPAEAVDQADHRMLDVAEPKDVTESADSEPGRRRSEDVGQPWLGGHRLAESGGGRLR